MRECVPGDPSQQWRVERYEIEIGRRRHGSVEAGFPHPVDRYRLAGTHDCFTKPEHGPAIMSPCVEDLAFDWFSWETRENRALVPEEAQGQIMEVMPRDGDNWYLLYMVWRGFGWLYQTDDGHVRMSTGIQSIARRHSWRLRPEQG